MHPEILRNLSGIMQIRVLDARSDSTQYLNTNKDPRTVLKFKNAEITMKGKQSQVGSQVFNNDFSLSVKGAHMLDEAIFLQLWDGQSVFGELEIKLSTLLGGQAVDPSLCNDIEQLKSEYAKKREHWLPLFLEDRH